jgi:D-alanine transaminase
MSDEQVQVLYLNGKVIATADAKISVFDYGFLFGAGVYDVGFIHDGLIFQGKEHLERFFQSAALVGIPIKESKEDILQIVIDLVARNNIKDGIVCFQATFGAYGRRSHKLPADVSSPTLLIFTQYVAPYPAPYFTEGVKVTTQPDFRWTRCNIKTTSLLPALLVINQLSDDEAEAIFYDPASKLIRECASSNVFCIKHSTIYTPPLSKYILPGIERRTILAIAKDNHMSIAEEDFTLAFLLDADEVFISSTTKEVLPVKQVDDVEFQGTPGPITRKLMRLFVEYVETELSIVHQKRSLGLF